MKKSVLFLTALLITILAAESCRKNDNNDVAITTAEDLSANEDYTEQIDLDADIAVEERGGGTCPTVTFAQPEGTWPNTITIDYGASCTRPDGRVLSGKIIINQTAEIRTAGAVRTITHENFFVDGTKVEGTRTWTNNGQNVDGLWSYTKVATDMKLTFEDGTFTTWNKTRTSVLIEGGSTATHWDDVWSSTGIASGINRNGVDFTATITEPLIKSASCRWISSGIIEFSAGVRTRTLDFGDGTCDRFGTLTLANGDSYTIRLRR
ncbi:MAG TPA: hypothetical protein VK168_09440 [Saprospiraceae bacterium]|nr:hypothetical protein [Saprospiraceae bacterium]